MRSTKRRMQRVFIHVVVLVATLGANHFGRAQVFSVTAGRQAWLLQSTRTKASPLIYRFDTAVVGNGLQVSSLQSPSNKFVLASTNTGSKQALRDLAIRAWERVLTPPRLNGRGEFEVTLPAEREKQFFRLEDGL